jgi:phage-related baseplate assembly protein
MATPEFIDRDLQAIIDDMIADYEQRTGRTLYPAQAERLLINTFAYREQLVREKIQYAATQNLVDFSNAPVLDYLGALLGVQRLAASKSTCKVAFSLVGNTSSFVTIPQGTRVASADGQVVFQTIYGASIAPGVTAALLDMEALTAGASANNLAIGTVKVILDPQPFVSGAANTTVSGGGADEESDTELRERIKLAPASFSNAGSRGAYEYFARSASPSIIDVVVLGPNDTPATAPGEVEVYPLMEDGSQAPQTVLDLVSAAVNSEKVRPLTDQVTVIAPTKVDYTLDVNLTIFTDAISATVQAAVMASLNAFALEKRKSLGQDIMRSQIIARCMVDGVYNAAVAVPAADLIMSSVQYGFCTGITVNVIGTTNG